MLISRGVFEDNLYIFKLIPGVNYFVKSLVVNFCDTVDGKHPAPKEMQIMRPLPYQPVHHQR